jgi:hypothetical protein
MEKAEDKIKNLLLERELLGKEEKKLGNKIGRNYKRLVELYKYEDTKKIGNFTVEELLDRSWPISRPVLEEELDKYLKSLSLKSYSYWSFSNQSAIYIDLRENNLESVYNGIVTILPFVKEDRKGFKIFIIFGFIKYGRDKELKYKDNKYYIRDGLEKEFTDLMDALKYIKKMYPQEE